LRSNILCLETSAAKCSVALTYAHDQIIYKEAAVSYSHVSQITLLIKECIEEANIKFEELDAVAISGGPGSYTGLRVGASTAKGICFAKDIPLIALDTLQVIGHTLIAHEANHGKSLYISIIDARRDEVYLAGYDKELDQVLDNQAFILSGDSFKSESDHYGQIIIGGDATAKAADIISSNRIIYRHIIPNAGHMAELALKAFSEQVFEQLSSYTPSYLKSPNITVSKKQFFRNN